VSALVTYMTQMLTSLMTLIDVFKLLIRARTSVRRVEEHGARPLSALTGGIHLHTVRCPDEKTFRRVRKSLEAENFLLNM